MHFLLFLFLIVGCWCDIWVSIDENGGYNITVNNRVWLRSSRTAIYADNRWYSTENMSLPLVNISTAEGNDPTFGSWNETRLTYLLLRQQRTTPIIARIRQWSSVSALTFYLETGDVELTTNVTLQADDVRTVFPSFLIEKMDENDHRGYFTVAGQFGGADDKHAGLWNASSRVVRLAYHGGPIVVFNLTERGEGDTLILSPLSHFMDTSLTQTTRASQSILEYGVAGSMISIPANYMQAFIVYYSEQGVNKGAQNWGQTLQRVYNRTNEYRLNDLSLNYLGYYIDNGGYYCYNTLPGTNYEDTMIEIAEQTHIPYHYMEISAWFYYKGVRGGVSNWTARPDVFPHGIPYLYRRLGNLPFIIHNRYWAYDAVYQDKYAWILDPHGGTSLPASNDSFWLDLLSEARDWGVILYQQDWLSLQSIWFRPILTEIGLGERWLTSMGEAANQVGLNIHYIMAYPRHFLKALEIPRVTQARGSDDYAINLMYHTQPQWNMGITSMIIDALGIAPNKDVLWSTSVQPDSPYGENASEPLPDRAILVATLSTGPVGVGDRINYTNLERIMRCCRQDGLILKPDRAITSINALVADWADNDGVPQGELYSTQTTINNQTFHIVFASDMKRDYTIYPSMIYSQPGILWFYNDTEKTSIFNDTQPLDVSASRCDDSAICVWYISPLWQFDDPMHTKYALCGEWNKWTAISRQRFLSITKNTGNTQTTIVIQGAASEIVSVVVYHSTLHSVMVNCSISASNDQTTVIITPTNVVCS